ncbi:GAP family protein [Mycobacterium sp. SMC-21]|uniref:GAP family protein n=1 Tax=Mycobacterium sp. SMC-21 TaxID=3381632 RepID=UPI00387670DD
MWITLLVMAVAVSLEPFRIGMSVVMLNRPRPHLQLAAFLCGGFLMGLSVGAVVLFFLESRLPAWASAHFNLPTVQIVIGVLALVAAVLLAVTKGRERTVPDWLTRLLTGRSLWVAGVAGLGIALPSVDYLAALAVIAAAHLEAGVRMGALVTFNVVAFSLVEIPLLAYLIAPQRTRTAMSNLHNWIRARQRHEVAGLLAVVGVVLVAAGALGI